MEKPSGRFWLLALVGLVSLVVIQQVWHWEVERIEVPPGKFLVLVHRWGKNLPEDEIVARDTSYKGVMLDVLGEGRHFLNPIFWSHEFHDIKQVPAGKCLVLTRKFGTLCFELGDATNIQREHSLSSVTIRKKKHTSGGA